MSVQDAATDEAREEIPAASQAPIGMNETELQQIVEVATSYLETGLFDDADDILQEVLEAGTVSPEIEDLIKRIELARGDVGQTTTLGAPVEKTQDQPARRRPLIYFTAPLAGAERLPRPVQRLIAETERDFNENRRHSALDLCYVVMSAAPDYIPNFLRAAQIRIALGDQAGAQSIIESVQRLHELDGVRDDPMLRGMFVAMNPDDTQALIEQAKYMLQQPVLAPNDPFIPAAIEATQDADPVTARELARAYVERRPNDEAAVRTYLRSAVLTAAPEEIHEALRTKVPANCEAIDLLWWRAASSAFAQQSDWTQWMARAIGRIQEKPDNYGRAKVAVERSASFVPEHFRYLGGALFALSANQWDAAQAELDDWRIVAPEDVSPLEAFVAACAQLEVIEYLGQQDVIPTLDTLIRAAVAVKATGESTDLDLFSMKTTTHELFDRYLIALGVHDAHSHGTEFLQSLSQEFPDNLAIRQIYAKLLIDSGKLNDGIQELRSIAKLHERAGDLQAMAAAMREISKAVPDNVVIKRMLIDIYLKRGILDEALNELEAVALLKHEEDDSAGAIEAYTRAAEIACAMGNMALGNDLYDRGVAADPDNVPVRHAAVAFYLQTGTVARATEHLREIVRIALAEQDPDEAVAALHQIIGLDPGDFDSYHKLGEVLTAMGEYKQAERVYRRLADIAPNDPVLQAKQSALAVLAATG